MSKIELLRMFLNQRLTMAAEEIFGVVEETIAVYQEENSRLRSMLDIVIKPDILLHRIDIQQPTHPVSEKEVLPEQQHCEQEWSPSLGQEDPHYIQIKEEPEELQSSLKNDYNHQDLTQSSLTQSSLLYETQSEDYEETYCLPKRHLRSHTGEKPFHCHDCGKGFTQRGHLNLHMRSHTGEKPHQCQDCGKCFSQNTSLIVHMRTHTGEKPYMCPVCRKCFTTSSMLKKHQTAHKHIGVMNVANATMDSDHMEPHEEGLQGEHMTVPCVGGENQTADRDM